MMVLIFWLLDWRIQLKVRKLGVIINLDDDQLELCTGTLHNENRIPYYNGLL